jgi:SAM-dependent methyltransferase
VTRFRIHRAAANGYEASVVRYERGRPGYPDDTLAYLAERIGIRAGRDVVELGAGTGRFTRSIVPSGASITAIEPVAAMRPALERNCPTVAVLDGTAEAIPLPDGSGDAVVAAQAFHRFDGGRALREIHRILRPAGRLGLIWNVRDEASLWSKRLTAIFDRPSEPSDPRYRSGVWREAFATTELFGPLHHRASRHVHTVTREGFVDRVMSVSYVVMSVSYVASAPDEVRREVLAEVHDLLDTDPELRGRSEIPMPYRTDVFWCGRR